MGPAETAPPIVVLDTNVVLDWLLFGNPESDAVAAAIVAGELRWVATRAMRDELARVLDYPQIVPRLAFYKLTDTDVLNAFDRHARLVAPAPAAGIRCKDPDDQIYIDLAVAHGARLFSKDGAVRAMRKRLAALGAELV